MRRPSSFSTQGCRNAKTQECEDVKAQESSRPRVRVPHRAFATSRLRVRNFPRVFACVPTIAHRVRNFPRAFEKKTVPEGTVTHRCELNSVHSACGRNTAEHLSGILRNFDLSELAFELLDIVAQRIEQ